MDTSMISTELVHKCAHCSAKGARCKNIATEKAFKAESHLNFLVF